jgi:hypothetical protein
MRYKSQYEIIQNRNGKLRELIVAEHLISEGYEFAWTDCYSVHDLIVTDDKGKTINIQVKPWNEDDFHIRATFQANNPESKRFADGETYFDYNVDCIAIVDIHHRMKAPLFLWKNQVKKNLKCVLKKVNTQTKHIKFEIDYGYYKNLQGFTKSKKARQLVKDLDYSAFTSEWDSLTDIRRRDKELLEREDNQKRLETDERKAYLKTMYCMFHQDYYHVAPYNQYPNWTPTHLVKEGWGSDKLHLWQPDDLDKSFGKKTEFEQFIVKELKEIYKDYPRFWR